MSELTQILIEPFGFAQGSAEHSNRQGQERMAICPYDMWCLWVSPNV